jgi:hypothetical protein
MLSAFRNILNGEKDFPQTVRKIIAVASIAIAILCVIPLLPPVRTELFALAERLLRHPLGNLHQRDWTLWTTALGALFAFFLTHCAFARKTLTAENSSANTERFYSRATLILIAAYALCGFILAFQSKAIWDDEFHTIMSMTKPPSELLLIQSGDTHPPLYHLTLKTFSSLFGQDIRTLKVFSVFPMLCTMLLLAVFLRKEFSPKAAFFAILSLVASEGSCHYFVEMRGYTLAMFFVTLAAVASWYVIKTNKLLWWAVLLIAVEGAAYTHYYAGAAAAIECGLLFLWFVLRDRKHLPQILLFAGATFVCYLPWISTAAGMFSQTNGSFWILPMTFSGALACFTNYFWAGGEDLYKFYTLLAYAVFLCLLLKKDKTPKEIFAFAVFGVSVLLALACIIVSVFSHPIHTARYFFPVSGCVWLFFGVAATTLKNSRLTLTVGAFLGGLAFASLAWAYDQEKTEGAALQKFLDTAKPKVRADDVFYFATGNTTAEMRNIMHFFPENIYVATGDDELSVDKNTGKIKRWHRDGFYRQYGPRKIYVEALSTRPELAKRRLWVVKRIVNEPFPNLENIPGLNAKFLGKFGWLGGDIEGYKFNIYLVDTVAAFTRRLPEIEQATLKNKTHSPQTQKP